LHPEIQEELAAVLASAPFAGSRRSQDFLSFVVRKMVEQDAQGLKERTIAVEVFGRKANADLDHDSIVRVAAREVRKRLAEYYAGEGAARPLRIDLPTGSYHPVFHARAPEPQPVPAPASELAPPRRRWKLATIPAAALLCAAVLLARWVHPPAQLFDIFWEPLLKSPGDLLFVIAHPIVYHPSERVRQLNSKHNPQPPSSPQHPIRLPAETVLQGSDIVPVVDQYVGFGDAEAALRFKELAVKRGRSSRLLLASRLEFADLRGAAAVLIGAFTNRWTLEVSRGLRFRFSRCAGRPCVEDSTTGKTWTLSGKSDNGRSNEDYIVISRLSRGRTGGVVVLAAGIMQQGTQEAGRILTDPSDLNQLLSKLPPSWRNLNTQMVLHTEIVGDAPGPPELVTWHVW
jgi:hypothetical protein